MEHSIALVTGATSGLGHAAACLLAAEGYREVIVTGRSLARIQETAAQLAAETRRRSSRPWSWIWTRRPAFSPPSPRSSSEVGRSTSYCSMPDWSQPRSA
jgi:NAD(P)-dependent dehydrogenase (short-subunit alcohol dehydrogenase family)